MSSLSRNKFAYMHISDLVQCIDSSHHIESRSLCIFKFKDNSLKNVGKLMRLTRFLDIAWIWNPASLFPFHLTYLCSGTDQGTTETQQKCFLMHVVAMIFCKLNIKESHLSKKDRCIKANLNYVQQLIKYRSTGANAFN